MSFFAIDSWWWPLVFILVAGWLATDIWRWLGVLLGNRIDDGAEALIYVRSVATALVAGLIAKLILYPSGALAETGMALRIVAAIAGFVTYIGLNNRLWAGVSTSLVVLVFGMFMGM